MSSTSAVRPRPVPLPRTWGIRAGDAWALLLANGVFVALMWVRHGGMEQLTTLGGALTAIGQLTGLEGTYLALVGVVLMGRSPWLDEAFGLDALARAHRWLGFASVWLIGVHFACITAGYALGDGRTLVDELVDLLVNFPFVLWAFVGFLLFVMTALVSLRWSRRRVSYEAWYWLHLTTYLAIAFAFLHQLFAGADFMHDPLAAGYWTALYAAAVALVLVFRVGQPLVASLRHGLRVVSVAEEAPGVTSIYLAGRHLDRLAIRSGQFLIVRFLTRQSWWRAHPFAISSAPNGQWLRITVKVLGDDSARLQHVAVGTRVWFEGPYGVLTGLRRTRRKVTLIAGGIGITPLRALLESLSARPGDLTLLYRASRPEDLVFRRELDQLADHRGATVRYLVGSRRDAPPAPPLNAAALRALVPDIAEQDVYLCGPEELMRTTEQALRTMGVPRRQVHAEHFTV